METEGEFLLFIVNLPIIKPWQNKVWFINLYQIKKVISLLFSQTHIPTHKETLFYTYVRASHKKKTENKYFNFYVIIFRIENFNHLFNQYIVNNGIMVPPERIKLFYNYNFQIR